MKTIDTVLSTALTDAHAKATASAANGGNFGEAYRGHVNGVLASDEVRPNLDAGKFFAVACAATSAINEAARV